MGPKHRLIGSFCVSHYATPKSNSYILFLESKSLSTVFRSGVTYFSSCERVVEDSTVLGLFVAGYPAFSVQ